MDCLRGDTYVMYLRVYVQLLQSCPNSVLPCGPTSPSVRGILQARMLGWVVSSPPGDPLHPGIEPVVSRSTCMGRWVLYQEHHWKAHVVYLLIHKLPCLILSNNAERYFLLCFINEEFNCLENR